MKWHKMTRLATRASNAQAASPNLSLSPVSGDYIYHIIAFLLNHLHTLAVGIGDDVDAFLESIHL